MITQNHWDAMGTMWHITLDHAADQVVPESLWTALQASSHQFERQYSRFIPTSEVNRWRQIDQPQTVVVSPALAELLEFSQTLKHRTQGGFDPAVGGLLEAAGYDDQYSLKPKHPLAWQAPNWELQPPNILKVSGPLVIDIGGFGKGYWIDQLSQQLIEAGFPHHLVDGGGDMFATTKTDGTGWRVAIEFPGKPDEALDIVTLQNQALAVSDTLKRNWGEWNHVVDPRSRQPSHQWISAAVIAPSAMVADALTTALMVSPTDLWAGLTDKYQASYLLLTPSKIPRVHQAWPGQLLAK